MAVSQTLSVTEVAGSVNNSANTSKVRILWQSTQTGDSWNGYTKTAKYYVSINGGAETVYSVSYTLPKSSTKTIVDTTITVAHNNNGTGTVKVRTWMDTGISAGEVELDSGTISLTTIPRASTLSYVSNVTLGNICTVKWTPRSKGFYYKIKFEVGSWNLTTAAIHPNVTTLYTNASYGISLDAAHQFPNSKDADMTVTLYTYSDKDCTKQIGTASTTKSRVYIPENENTVPTVKMALSPISTLDSAFDGLYIQNKTKVEASFTGSEAKYSASISSYSLAVSGLDADNTSPYQSDWLTQSGTITVRGTAKDTRGCSASKDQTINVIAYSKPSVIPYTGEKAIVCQRCTEDGTLSPSGTYLRVKAGRQYSKVTVDDTQKNFCLLRYRCKTESASSFSSWGTLLAKSNTGTDEVDAIIENAVPSKTTSYIVQIGVIDDIGEQPTPLEFTIPTDQVTIHLKHGGKGVAFGKYAEEDNVVDIAEEWELKVRGTICPNHIAAIDTYHYKDFNELVYQTGYYTGSSAPSAVSCLNYPSNETGLLEVISTIAPSASSESGWWGFAYQTYRTHNGLIYLRSYFSSTGWTAWKKVTLT